MGLSPISSKAGACGVCDAPMLSGRSKTSGVAQRLACGAHSPQVQGSQPCPARIWSYTWRPQYVRTCQSVGLVAHCPKSANRLRLSVV